MPTLNLPYADPKHGTLWKLQIGFFTYLNIHIFIYIYVYMYIYIYISLSPSRGLYMGSMVPTLDTTPVGRRADPELKIIISIITTVTIINRLLLLPSQ